MNKTTRKTLTTIRRFAAVFALAALASCAGSPDPTDTTNLSAPKLVQLAQDAADLGEYELAGAYYQQVRDRFPTDTERVLWATYEIAFLQHKMGNDPEAIRLLGELIASYGEEPDLNLPQGPRILAEKVKTNLEAAVAESAKNPS